MKQISFAQAEYQNKKKVTRRERLLAQMDSLVPWQRLINALSPFYCPLADKQENPPISLERMLRVYFLQQWYALGDETLEDAIYDTRPCPTSPSRWRAKLRPCRTARTSS